MIWVTKIAADLTDLKMLPEILLRKYSFQAPNSMRNKDSLCHEEYPIHNILLPEWTAEPYLPLL